MRLLRGIGRFFWRFMVIFSFIVNLVLIVILLGAGLFIFQIKGQVADPLIGGLHSTAAGLSEATIDWTIPVREPQLPVNLLVPINANTITSTVTEINGNAVDPIPGETVVRLTRAVPITINNAFIQSNDLTLRNATVSITLPAGTQLPVALNLEVGVDSSIPVELDVRAVIPLSETQLNDPIETLGLLFEPLSIGLHNLPNDFSEGGQFVRDVWNRGTTSWGDHLASLLLSADGTGFNTEPYNPWVGYSQTAGLNYDLIAEPFPQANQPVQTGIVPPGGIPALDALLPDRAPFYQGEDTPADVVERAIASGAASQLPSETWSGDFAGYYRNIQNSVPATYDAPPAPAAAPDTSNNATGGAANPPEAAQPEDSGILPTPSSP